MRLIRLLKNDIAKEAEEWVKDDIITEAQAVVICERYSVDYHQIKTNSFGYNTLIGLGYLFIGLSLITLLGANWDEIPRAIRMCGLIALTMATQGLAISKHMRDDGSGTGLFLLGNLFYGASIILIAQIYHLGEHMPDGVFWWALGCLPIAILVNNAWLTMQAALLGLLWFFMEIDKGFYPLAFPVFILGSLIVLYRGNQSLALFLTTIASLGFWVEYTLAELWRDTRRFDFHAEHVVVSVGLFIFAYAFSQWMNRRSSAKARDYAAILSVWSLRFGLILMLIMSFKEPWKELIGAPWEHQLSMMFLVIVLSISSLYLAYTSNKLKTLGTILPFFLLSLVAVMLSKNTGSAIYFQVIYNLALISTGGWLIIRGIHNGVSHYFFLGVATILITAFMRYIDLIGDYLGGAALFMVFAVLLLGAARYWKSYQSREVSQ